MWGGHRVHVGSNTRIYCDDDMCHCWAHRAPGTIDGLDDLEMMVTKMTSMAANGMFSNGQWG